MGNKKGAARAAPSEELTESEAKRLADLAKKPHDPSARRENAARAKVALEEHRKSSGFIAEAQT